MASSSTTTRFGANKTHWDYYQGLIATASAATIAICWKLSSDDCAMVTECHGKSTVARSTTCRERRQQLDDFLKKKSSSTSASTQKDLYDLPIYTSEQVSKQNGFDTSSTSNRIWMSYGGYVYDVTDFIEIHPGGTERISRAAGSALELYWYLHTQHYDTEIPLEILESLIIGRLNEQDQRKIDTQVDQLQEELDQFRLVIELPDNNVQEKLSMKDITMLPKTDMISQVGCPNSNQDRNPVTTSLFAGVKLKELLPSSNNFGGQELQKITFHALDGETYTVDIDLKNSDCESNDSFEDILICYEMNGMPLTQSRGFPLRVIIPEGPNRKRRAVKWVQKITVQ